MAFQRGGRFQRMVLMRYFTLLLCAYFFGCSGNSSESSNTVGAHSDVKGIFSAKCALCHGHDGRQQYAGAKNLGESILPLEEVVKIISEGKGNMPPHRGTLSAEEIQLLATYVLTLRNP